MTGGYPTLKPAFSIIAEIDPALPIGALSTGGSQVYVSIRKATITSEPTFEPVFRLELVAGGDWIHQDPSGETMRLDVKSVFEDGEGGNITFTYQGIMKLNDAIRAAFAGSPDAKTTGFGNIVATQQFKTGVQKYKFLEDSMFVGSGQLVIEGGKTLVEYKCSQVVA